MVKWRSSHKILTGSKISWSHEFSTCVGPPNGHIRPRRRVCKYLERIYYANCQDH